MRIPVALTLAIGLFAGEPAIADTGSNGAPYLASAKRFADVVLDKGRDEYGKRTPLFVDGLHAETLNPATWVWKDGKKWIVSNLASQQPLFRLLDGLTGVTGEGRYQEAAEEAMRYALENSRTPNGMLHWGGHTAWDLLGDEAIGTAYGKAKKGVVRYNHELKAHQPYYEMMWRVNPEATKIVMERVWGGHVVDWSKLDYNRHAKTHAQSNPEWDAEFDGEIQVPFPATGNNLSFCTCVPPFLHAGTMLAVHDKNEQALTWTRRMAYRWQQARHPKTGLCGGQLSYREQDRAWEALGHVHPDINEAKIVGSYHQTTRYHKLPLAQMQAAETLIQAGGPCAKVGRDFITWASDDLQVYARRCYNPDQRKFVALMIDGKPLKWQETKVTYYWPSVFAPARPDGWLFWGYAMAYRLTRDPAHWAMLGQLSPEFGLSGLGERPGSATTVTFKPAAGRHDWRTIYALLELHKATGNGSFLTAACAVGDELLKLQNESGIFTRPAKSYAGPEDGEQTIHAVEPGRRCPAYSYGRTGDEIPLALLHLAAALKGKSAVMPQAILDDRFFHCPYYGELEPHQQKYQDTRTYDWLVFYGED